MNLFYQRGLSEKIDKNFIKNCYSLSFLSINNRSAKDHFETGIRL